MTFSKSIHDKIKLFVLLVSFFIFLSLFLALDFFIEIPLLIYIVWLLLYSTVVLFSGFIYGFLTKSRVKSVLLGFSFPIVFAISQFIIVSYQVDNFNTVPPYYISPLVSAKFVSILFIVSISNLIACWFASTTEEIEKRKKVSHFISIVFITVSLFFMILVFFSLTLLI